MMRVDICRDPKPQRQIIAEPIGKLRRIGWMACHQRMRLDVEHELFRCSLDPTLSCRLGWKRVVSRIDFDHGQMRRKEAKRSFGCSGVIRIKTPGGKRRRISPARHACENS